LGKKCGAEQEGESENEKFFHRSKFFLMVWLSIFYKKIGQGEDSEVLKILQQKTG
jgi:hypothetical protein